MKIYHKLVRDRIPEIIEKSGNTPVTHWLSDVEYLEQLNKKLLEEVQEYQNSNEIEELADLEEVLLSILKYRKVSLEEFSTLREKKKEERGGFDQRILLEKVMEGNE